VTTEATDPTECFTVPIASHVGHHVVYGRGAAAQRARRFVHGAGDADEVRAQLGRLGLGRRLRFDEGARSSAPGDECADAGGDKQQRLDDQTDGHDDQRALKHSNICRHLLHSWVTCYPFS